MADLKFKKEAIEESLNKVGFSHIQSVPLLSFENTNECFRTTAYLHKNCSREIVVLVECFETELAITMRNNIELQVLNNSRRVILKIEEGRIYDRDRLELSESKSKGLFYGASGKLTQFIYLIKKEILRP